MGGGGGGWGWVLLGPMGLVVVQKAPKLYGLVRKLLATLHSAAETTSPRFQICKIYREYVCKKNSSTGLRRSPRLAEVCACLRSAWEEASVASS